MGQVAVTLREVDGGSWAMAVTSSNPGGGVAQIAYACRVHGLASGGVSPCIAVTETLVRPRFGFDLGERDVALARGDTAAGADDLLARRAGGDDGLLACRRPARSRR